MNAAKSRNSDSSILLTLEQTCEMANLGATKVRELAKESGSERKIGRSYRIHKATFFGYIEALYS